ncbi:SEC-C motif-containing protein [Cryobacterium sp. CG_9.6]|nr:SEC-C motif-containing protein [Cryobacterium sp. CG_9.6]
MGSRYSAFAVGDAAYLLATWHPLTAPATLTLEAGMVWTRLVIDATSGGGPFEREGVVEFTAHYRLHGERGSQHETSRFVRDARVWLYVDGVE